MDTRDQHGWGILETNLICLGHGGWILECGRGFLPHPRDRGTSLSPACKDPLPVSWGKRGFKKIKERKKKDYFLILQVLGTSPLLPGRTCARKLAGAAEPHDSWSKGAHLPARLAELQTGPSLILLGPSQWQCLQLRLYFAKAEPH